MMAENLILVELTSEDALADGKPFDGLAAGTFMDMWFQRAELRLEDFPEIVSNTNEAIEATHTESGELVGLPIDARGHENGDGAGWIVSASLENDKIRLTPKWTEIGLELLKKGIRRFFSATVDIDNKVILGGTLTNWPATRDKKGKILLRPIELETDHQFYEMEEVTENMFDIANDAFTIADTLPPFDLKSLATNVVDSTKKYYEAIEKIFYRKHDAATDDLASHRETAPNDAGEEVMPDEQTNTNLEVVEMEISKEELTELIGAQVREVLTESLRDLTPEPQGQSDNGADGAKVEHDFDPIAFLEMQDAENDVVQALKAKWLESYDHMRKRALMEAQGMIDSIRREADVQELRNLATTGTEESPRAFPVEPESLEEFMLSLDKAQLSYFKKFITTTLEKGMLEFEELGHGRDVEGTLDLPDEIAAKLESGEFTIADLKNPILGLGDLSRYNLAQWKVKE